MTIAVRATQFDRYAFMTDYPLLLQSDEIREEYDGFTHEDWVAEFIGDGTTSEAMQIGICFHLLMESLTHRWPDAEEMRDGISTITNLPIKGRTVSFRWLCSPDVFVYGAESEVFNARHVATSDVLITGHSDAIAGSRVIEYKTSAKRADIARYMRSWQWRVYLYLTGLDHFTYHCFKVAPMRVTKAIRREPWYSDRQFFVDVKEHATLDLARYDGMDAEVEAYAAEIADWMLRSGIAEHAEVEDLLAAATEGDE